MLGFGKTKVEKKAPLNRKERREARPRIVRMERGLKVQSKLTKPSLESRRQDRRRRNHAAKVARRKGRAS